jgi:hypothetical protein
MTTKKLSASGGLKDGLIVSDKAAWILGLQYFGISKEKPDYDTIAMTDFYDVPGTKRIEQHFFIVLKDGTRFDPLGSSKVIDYKIVEYRLFKRKEQVETELEKYKRYFLARKKEAIENKKLYKKYVKYFKRRKEAMDVFKKDIKKLEVSSELQKAINKMFKEF